ncbi:MAG: ribonuclease PH [bacterium]
MRIDGRKQDEMRILKIQKGFMKYAEGSALIEMGDTKIICTASIENKVPPFLVGKNKGWITAEYGMLPRSTEIRMIRDAVKGKINGRSLEIQRLIGRSLRAVVDLNGLGERTIWLDCDVINADGGTRTAAVTGAFIALYQALTFLKEKKMIPVLYLKDYLGAISVGISKGTPVLDLNYTEDSQCEVDMNVVMTGKGHFVEIQATAEGRAFTDEQYSAMIGLARKGIKEIIEMEKKMLPDGLIL